MLIAASRKITPEAFRSRMPDWGTRGDVRNLYIARPEEGRTLVTGGRQRLGRTVGACLVGVTESTRRRPDLFRAVGNEGVVRRQSVVRPRLLNNLYRHSTASLPVLAPGERTRGEQG